MVPFSHKISAETVPAIRGEVRRRLNVPRRVGLPKCLWLCSHHKAGTVWLRRQIMSIVRPYGWTLERIRSSDEIYERFGQEVLPVFDTSAANFDQRVFFDAHSRVEVPEIVDAGIHLIRDPREIIRSGVLYHQHTHEAWANRKSEHFDNRSYKEFLREATESESLLLEIEYCKPTLEAMVERSEQEHPKIATLKYEDVVGLEPTSLSRILQETCFPALESNSILKSVSRVSQEREIQLDMQRPPEKRHFSKHLGRKPEWTADAEGLLRGILGDWLSTWYPPTP